MKRKFLRIFVCIFLGHKSFAERGTISKDWDFCDRCLKGIGRNNNQSKPREEDPL